MPHPLPVIAHTFLVTQHIDNVGHERHPFVSVMCIGDISMAATPAQVATKFAAQYAAHLMPPLSNGIVMGNTDVIPLDGVTSTQSFTTASAGTTGGVGGSVLPNAAAYVLAWQTGLRGRRNRGRTYLPGVVGANVVDSAQNGLTGGTVTALAAAGNAFIAGLVGGAAPSLALEVLSRKFGSANPAVNCRADSGLGIQRRRYERVARH